MYGFYIALIIILVISFVTGNIILYFEHKEKALEKENIKEDIKEDLEEQETIKDEEPEELEKSPEVVEKEDTSSEVVDKKEKKKEKKESKSKESVKIYEKGLTKSRQGFVSKLANLTNLSFCHYLLYISSTNELFLIFNINNFHTNHFANSQVGMIGLEPTIFSLPVNCSNLLSYTPN